MTSGVIAVSVNSTVELIARLLTMHRISRVAVLDEHNRVVGVVREDDLFVRMRRVAFSREQIPALFDEWVDLDRLPEIYAQVRNRTAKEVMRQNIGFVEADEEIVRAVELMLRQGLKEVLVLENGELCGIITRADLVGLLARSDR
jgi:CBS-domain-containing membrane protein